MSMTSVMTSLGTNRKNVQVSKML